MPGLERGSMAEVGMWGSQAVFKSNTFHWFIQKQQLGRTWCQGCPFWKDPTLAATPILALGLSSHGDWATLKLPQQLDLIMVLGSPSPPCYFQSPVPTSWFAFFETHYIHFSLATLSEPVIYIY